MNVTREFGEQIALQATYKRKFSGLCMASADDYRLYAEVCVALARKSSNPGDKARLLQIAQAWRELAARRDASQNKSTADAAQSKSPGAAD
jgi:hypothetical protein